MDQPLVNIQRWMQAVITHTAGVAEGLSDPAAQSELAVGAADVEQVVPASSKQSSVERLSIYAGAYHARLIECLQSEFPVFRQTVGDDAFADFAVTYLQQHPSQSYTLGQLGASFIEFLRETKPPPQPSHSEPGWANFLIDLARLERTVSEVFDGPGVENLPPLTNDALLSLDSERWPQARLKTVPCLRLMPLQFPLNDYYTAVKKLGSTEVSPAEYNSTVNGSISDAIQQTISTIAIPAARDSWLAITRRNYIVRRYELTKPQFLLLNALDQGQTVGDAIAAAAQVYAGDVDQFAADLRQWFSTWTAAPMFERVTISG
jgi:hypothetical protein